MLKKDEKTCSLQKEVAEETAAFATPAALLVTDEAAATAGEMVEETAATAGDTADVTGA